VDIKQTISFYTKNPRKLVRTLGARNCLNWIPDKQYLKMVYYAETGAKLDLDNPTTFNEKIQWLKLYDRNPLYIKTSDKFEVRKYIADKIGDEYLIPLLNVWETVDDIDFDLLPESFVLKCTHGSTSNIICKNKNNLEIDSTKALISKWMKRNWFWFGREWPYKHIPPRIIAEAYMVDESGYELKDYKFFCFNGIPRLIQVHFDRYTNSKIKFFDTNWNYLPISSRYKTDPDKIIKKPERFYTMLDLAGKLSVGFPYMRVDFYSIGNSIFVGELTLYPASGFGMFSPDEWNYTLGGWIDLPLSSKDSGQKQ